VEKKRGVNEKKKGRGNNDYPMEVAGAWVSSCLNDLNGGHTRGGKKKGCGGGARSEMSRRFLKRKPKIGTEGRAVKG